MSVQTNQADDCVAATHSTKDGFEAFGLCSREVEVVVVPELGAKVISLRNRLTGREWMYHPHSGRGLFRNQPGDDFSRSLIAGWDECLPTIAPCKWNGRMLPDHGEVWSLPWKLDAAAWCLKRITTSVELPLVPFRFTRSVEVQAGLITVDYRLTNLSGESQRFLWAMHPLLALQPGDQLELPEEARLLLEQKPWIPSLDFGGSTAKCAKAFAGPLGEGRAGVFNPVSGDRITFEWDTQVCHTLGIWLTRGGWNGHHHLALEPANGASDSLAEAASQRQRCGLVSPFGESRWSVKIRIEP